MLQIDLKYILVIEASKDIREIIARSLENRVNWQVSLVDSIARGLALIQTQQPDVILLEANLLEQCDPNICQELQTTASNRSIPIIFMAARIRSMDRLQFKEFGAVDAIALPFDPKDLAEAIAKTLN